MYCFLRLVTGQVLSLSVIKEEHILVLVIREICFQNKNILTLSLKRNVNKRPRMEVC